MPNVQIADDLYREAKQCASEAGYASVDDFVAEVVRQNIREGAGQENFDDRFTPDVIAHLNRISPEMHA